MASHAQKNRHTACSQCGAHMTTYSEAPLCRVCRASRRERVCVLCGGPFRLPAAGNRRPRQSCPECRVVYQHKNGGTWSPLLRKRA